MQDTRTPPLLNAIYEQITRCTAGYDDLVDGSDISYNYVEDQAIANDSIRCPDLAHDEIPEKYRLRLQYIYTQFVTSQNYLREQLELSRVHQQELHADLLAAEHERERLVSTLEESDKKRQRAKARRAEGEVIVSKLRADLTAAMDHLERRTEVASSKDHIIQSVTEESQVAHVRLKYAEDKITHLNAKLQRERDRRLHKTKELLDEQVRVRDRHEAEIHRLKQEAQDAQVRVQDYHEAEIHRLKQEAQDAQVRVQDCHEAEIHRLKQEAQDAQVRVQDCHEAEIHRLKQEAQDAQVRVQDCHEAEIHRLKQEAQDAQVRVQDCHESEIHSLKQEVQDAQEQLDTLQGAMSRLHADGGSALDHDHSARHRQPATRSYDTCQSPLPPEPIYDTGTPPISPATNVDNQEPEDFSTHQDPISEVTQDYRAALAKLFERMRQGEYESAQDAVKPNNEQHVSRLQDELAVTKEQLCLAEEEVLTMRRDMDQAREALREVNTHLVSLRSEWEMCKAMLREAQDTRRSNMTQLAEVIDLLRVSQAESEESQFRCSQVTFLCAALQERVTELEAKVNMLKYPAVPPIHTGGVDGCYRNRNEIRNRTDSESRSRCPTGTGTGMCAHPIYTPSCELMYIFKQHPMSKQSSCKIQTRYTSPSHHIYPIF
jgi:chromosome segregation ATPase